MTAAPGLLLAAVLAGTPDGAALAQITEAGLKAHVRFLASDALEGRAPGTRGDALARAYLAAQLEGLGLQPAAPGGGWFQPVELLGVTGGPAQLTFVKGARAVTLEARSELMVVPGSPVPVSQVERAELVFAGYGIVAPRFDWDDFKGLDVTGKILVVLNDDPQDDPALFGGRARLWYGRWDYKFLQAAARGAAGCLILHTTPSAGYPWSVVQSSWSGEQLDLPRAGPSLALKGWLTEAGARRVLALSGADPDALIAAAQRRDFRPVPLGVTLSARWTNTLTRRQSANVLARLPGSDPALAREAVVITAHHDHLGVRADARPGEDAIYNGAVDNASGVAGLLVLARAAAALPRPPRRSLLFAALAAEEQGLLGAQVLVEHPPVPVARMAAVLNLDGLNVWGRTRDVSLIGPGKSSLDAVLEPLVRAQGRVLEGDAFVDRGSFYRSDQFVFARAGVPAAYFAGGEQYRGRPPGWGRARRELWEASTYHQVSDELKDDWDLSGAVEDVQLYLQLALQVADAPAMPTWTRGDEFEAARTGTGGR